MKRNFKSMLGVTLLEIMLVLAIAALIIVMSIRYYSQASGASKLNAAINSVTGVMASIDNYMTTNPASTGIGSTTLGPYLAGGALPNSPWGGKIGVTGTTMSYSIIFPMVPGNPVCSQFAGMLKQNVKLTPPACSTTAGSFEIKVVQ